MSRVAVVILNRNLPEVTDGLVEQFLAQDTSATDVFVVESGSDHERLSKYCTWWADWPEALQFGLRFPRGFNYALSQLQRSGRFNDYEHFFLVCNDISFDDALVPILLSEMEQHPRVGILSPCAFNWAERELIGPEQTRYVSHGNHIAWMVRRSYAETIMERHKADYMNFLYDGTNFRGYYADQELIIKAYVNDYAAAITTKCTFHERTELLKTRHDLIRTDRYEVNLRHLFEEGQEWMRRKYGFNTRRQMTLYAQAFYDRFFLTYPELAKYRL